MKQYIGTKVLLAQPMTRGAYNTYRGWPAPADEDQTTEGYLVEYQDGGTPNNKLHQGYISWSPKDVFEKAYRETSSGLSFGEAIEALKMGKQVCRSGWNGKGMWLHLVGRTQWTFTDGKQDNYPLLPFIAMKTAGDETVPWLASQTDMLAEDWQVLN